MTEYQRQHVLEQKLLATMGLHKLPALNTIVSSSDIMLGPQAKPELDDTEEMYQRMGLSKFFGVMESYVNTDPDLVDVALRTDADDILKIFSSDLGMRLLPKVSLRVELTASKKKLPTGGWALDVIAIKVVPNGKVIPDPADLVDND